MRATQSILTSVTMTTMLAPMLCGRASRASLVLVTTSCAQRATPSCMLRCPVAMASTTETDSYLLAIPNEVLLDIVKKAQDESLGKLACTCRALNSVTCDESIWRKRCTARWHRPAQALYQKARLANVSTEWRDMYIENNGWGARPLRHSLLSTSDDFHCMEVSPLAGALWTVQVVLAEGCTTVLRPLTGSPQFVGTVMACTRTWHDSHIDLQVWQPGSAAESSAAPRACDAEAPALRPLMHARAGPNDSIDCCAVIDGAAFATALDTGTIRVYRVPAQESESVVAPPASGVPSLLM